MGSLSLMIAPFGLSQVLLHNTKNAWIRGRVQLLTCACLVIPMLSQVIPQLIPDQPTTEKTSVGPLITPHDPIRSTRRSASTVGPALICMIHFCCCGRSFGPAVSTLVVIKVSERQKQQKVHCMYIVELLTRASVCDKILSPKVLTTLS